MGNVGKNMNICQDCNTNVSAGNSCVCRGENQRLTVFNLLQWGNDNGIEIHIENEDQKPFNQTTITFIDRNTLNYKTVVSFKVDYALEIVSYSLEKIFYELKAKPLRKIAL